MQTYPRIHTPLAVPPADEVIDERLLRVKERPDGYHWVDVQGRQEFGPFESLEDTLADMDGPSEEAIECSEVAELAEQGHDTDPLLHVQDDEPETAT